MNVFTTFHDNLSSGSWDVLLKTTKVNPMVAQEEKSEAH